MDQIFKKQKMPQLIQCETDYLTSTVTIKETELLNKTLKTRNLHVQMISLGNSIKHLKKH